MTRRGARSGASLAVAICMVAIPAAAQVMKQDTGGLEALAKADSRVFPKPEPALIEDVQGLVGRDVADGWAAFGLDHGAWVGYVDQRTGRLEYAEGAGVPWVPGRGNSLTTADIAMGFQVRAHNPMVGLEGRVELLRKLGGVGLERPGALFDILSNDGEVNAAAILAAILDKLSPIWPLPMGDVWPHAVIGLVPFHKLSQWLSYSLVEPLQGADLKVTGLDALTGLPEYRNGGLLIDTGVLRPKQQVLLEKIFGVGGGRIDRDVTTMRGLAGYIELIGGSLFGLGLFTRPVAFVLSGEMAVAYWYAHAPQSPFPLVNGGEAAVLFCFVFLALAVIGAGEWSVDKMLAKNRSHVWGYAAPGGERPGLDEE